MSFANLGHHLAESASQPAPLGSKAASIPGKPAIAKLKFHHSADIELCKDVSNSQRLLRKALVEAYDRDVHHEPAEQDIQRRPALPGYLILTQDGRLKGRTLV